MRCPFCNHQDDRVLDSRNQKEGEVIRRRRECLKCKGRFSTTETILLSYPLVKKKDGRSEDFSKLKLLSGLKAACHKRPISQSDIDHLVETVAKWSLDLEQKEISSHIIGHKVTDLLKNLDDVAYVRFASVYRTFEDVQEFVETLDSPSSLSESTNSSLNN